MKKQNIYVMLILSLFLVSCGQDTTENQTELPVVNQEVEAEVSTTDHTESLSVVFTDPSWDGTNGSRRTMV